MNKSQLLQKVFDFYQKQNISTNSGIEIPMTVQSIHVDGSLLQALPQTGKIVNDLERIGILLDGKERFVNHVIFPIHDDDHEFSSLAGIDVDTQEEQWLDENTIWNLPNVKDRDKVFEADSFKKAFKMINEGITNVVVRHGKVDDSPKVKTIPVVESKQTTNTDQVQHTSTGFVVKYGLREYELIDIERSSRTLKATIRFIKNGKSHLDTINLYSAKERTRFVRESCLIHEEPSESISNDLQKLLTLSEDYFKQPSDMSSRSADVPQMTKEEEREAFHFGRSDKLIENILNAYDAIGLIGEEDNKLLCYLAMTSRKMLEPISVLILSSSGAGKTALQDATLRFCPCEDVVKITSLSGKALFYRESTSLKHKLLAIEESEGADDASYAIRNLISSEALTSEATIRDNATGKLTTMANRVEGPVSVFLTTTNPNLDSETQSRFICLGIDESNTQTKRILDHQRRRQGLIGVKNRRKIEFIISTHQNFQRLLRRLTIVNPIADQIEMSESILKNRRLQPQLLALINSVAFLRQMTKKIKTESDGNNVVEYIEVDEQDMTIAMKLFNTIMDDVKHELTKPAVNLLASIQDYLKKKHDDLRCNDKDASCNWDELTFTRREVREGIMWGKTRLRTHLMELIESELVMPVNQGRNKLVHYRLVTPFGWSKKG